MPIDFNALATQAAQVNPVAAGVTAATDLLAGLIKDPKKRELFKTGMLTGLVGVIISLLKKKKWTAGQYILGERYLDHVSADTKDYGRGDVPDDIVELAQEFFTAYFGVRITTCEDLDALDGLTLKKGQSIPDQMRDMFIDHQKSWEKDPKGGSVPYAGTKRPNLPWPVLQTSAFTAPIASKDFTISPIDLYYMRPDKDDIPQVAVERAVFLKAKVLPGSWYNNIQKKIPIAYFTKYPLVAPLPGLQYKTLNDVVPWFDLKTNLMHIPENAPVQQKIEAELKNTVAMVTGGATNNPWLLAIPAFLLLYLIFSPKR